jgi:hypothetical protein
VSNFASPCIWGLASSGVAALTLVLGCSRPLRPEPEGASPPAAAAEPAPSERATPPTSASSAARPDGAVTRAPASKQGVGVAVLELFTSEGCSSCPPADRVLSRVAARAAAEALPVYTLSFHVDYWNYLGWRDRFSSASYSERQHGYSAISANGGTYTPQAVINGESECVGSDASQIDALISAALKHEPRTHIELEARRDNGSIDITYRVSGDTAGRVLNLALVEPHAESAVKSGENAGERLVHVNVVRAFTSHTLAADGAGSWSFNPTSDFGARRVGVVAYAEGAAQRDISGATALELD